MHTLLHLLNTLELISKFPSTEILFVLLIFILNTISDLQISITHGPPHGILDKSLVNVKRGCETLTEALSSLRPRIHVFGHVHKAHGVEVKTWTETERKTDDKNASNVTIFVNAANQPAGPKAKAHGGPISFGMKGFQPVVVDLLDVYPGETNTASDP